MTKVGEKQSNLMHQRQQLLHENFETDEKKSHEQHLRDQLADTEQLIEDTQEQIREI